MSQTTIAPQRSETYEAKFCRFLAALRAGRTDNIRGTVPLAAVPAGAELDTTATERWVPVEGGWNHDS